MAIQAQLYPSNNGYCAGGLVESCFNSQHKHHHNQQQQQQQQLEQRLRQLYNERQRPVDPNLLVHDSKALNSPSFAIQLEKQWEEIDQYIRLQNEKLRFMLQEQGKQQVTALLKRVESRSLCMLREKDEQIAQAVMKRIELEDLLTRLEQENHAWQRVAKEKEAMALALYKALEEMRERDNGAVANDAESCCDERRGNKEMGEEGMAESRVGCGGVGGDFEQITREMMLCKSCHSRTSCFMFLPCRHLSSCKACHAFLEACPICRMPKKASIETLIF